MDPKDKDAEIRLELSQKARKMLIIRGGITSNGSTTIRFATITPVRRLVLFEIAGSLGQPWRIYPSSPRESWTTVGAFDGWFRDSLHDFSLQLNTPKTVAIYSATTGKVVGYTHPQLMEILASIHCQLAYMAEHNVTNPQLRTDMANVSRLLLGVLKDQWNKLGESGIIRLF